MSLEKYSAVIGTVPDEKVAEMAGVTVEEVKAFRAAADDGGETAADDGDDDPDPDPDTAEGEGKPAEPAPEPAKAEPAPKPKPRRRTRKASTPKAPKPVEPKPVVHPTVRLTGNQVVKGPDGRRLRLSFRDVYSGEMARWLQKHHADLCEAYPKKG